MVNGIIGGAEAAPHRVNQNLKAMKRFIVKPFIPLVLISAMLFVSSCSKEVEVHEADLIGVWDIGQASFDIKVGPISLFQFLRTTMQLSEQEAQDYVDDLVAEYDHISGGTITFSADYSYLIENGDFGEDGTWELQGDKLYLTNTDEVLEDNPLKFETFDGSSALMAWEEDQEVDLNEDGTSDFTATLIIEVDLSKQ